PVLTHPAPRSVLGRVSAQVYGHPAQALTMIGVTGTQGKTTTTRLLEDGLLAAGVNAGVIGTVGTRSNGTEVNTALTTPEAPDLHGLLAAMVEAGVTVCAMEVSSHALVLGRVDGIVFDVAVFLNLGRDHLDFHTDLEDYFAAKASLFTPERARTALINTDDEHGRRLLGQIRIPAASFGAGADWSAAEIRTGPSGSQFSLVGPGVQVAASCPIPGAFNVDNTVAAIAAGAIGGLDPAAIARGIGHSAGVPGRLEPINAGQDFAVLVDYAHKPDAVQAALDTLRPLTQGRVIVVIGAGGDRDAGKRPVMGLIAAQRADLVIVTDDNPRSEDPAVIRAAVLEGARHGSAEVVEIGDRRAAIAAALSSANSGDVVLIAGKGHETGQQIGSVVHPFDDRLVARELLG
ncbi:MAG: UDP-N-acetylmuramoyl-L-alanyl-D-glutamate--2,6-diaminopimelate ligase, partial [Nocardioides sp.]